MQEKSPLCGAPTLGGQYGGDTVVVPVVRYCGVVMVEDIVVNVGVVDRIVVVRVVEGNDIVVIGTLLSKGKDIVL